MSALERITDSGWTSRHVSNVPITEIAPIKDGAPIPQIGNRFIGIFAIGELKPILRDAQKALRFSLVRYGRLEQPISENRDRSTLRCPSTPFFSSVRGLELVDIATDHRLI